MHVSGMRRFLRVIICLQCICSHAIIGCMISNDEMKEIRDYIDSVMHEHGGNGYYDKMYAISGIRAFETIVNYSNANIGLIHEYVNDYVETGRVRSFLAGSDIYNSVSFFNELNIFIYHHYDYDNLLPKNIRDAMRTWTMLCVPHGIMNANGFKLTSSFSSMSQYMHYLMRKNDMNNSEISHALADPSYYPRVIRDETDAFIGDVMNGNRRKTETSLKFIMKYNEPVSSYDLDTLVSNETIMSISYDDMIPGILMTDNWNERLAFMKAFNIMKTYADAISDFNGNMTLNDAMPALIENMNGMPFEYTLEIMKAGMP